MAQSDLHFLAVDDNPLDRALIQAFVEAEGWTLILALDGENGARAAEIERFDGIVLDQNLPGQSGMETARSIRAGGGPNHDAPILLWSAGMTPALAASAAEIPDIRSVRKPFSAEAFIAWAIEVCCAERSSLSARRRS